MPITYTNDTLNAGYYKWIDVRFEEPKDPLENVVMPPGHYIHKDGWHVEIEGELSLKTIKQCTVKYKGSLRGSQWQTVIMKGDLKFFLEQFVSRRFIDSKLDMEGLL